MEHYYTDYRMVLKEARANGLPEENYFLYIETKGGAIEFASEEEKRSGWIGYFVEDDERLPGIINVASRKVKGK